MMKTHTHVHARDKKRRIKENEPDREGGASSGQ